MTGTMLKLARPLTLLGLVLLCWSYWWVALVFFVLGSITRTTSAPHNPAILIRSTSFRFFVEVTSSIAAVVGIWFFPHFHGSVGPTTAIIMAVYFSIAYINAARVLARPSYF